MGRAVYNSSVFDSATSAAICFVRSRPHPLSSISAFTRTRYYSWLLRFGLVTLISITVGIVVVLRWVKQSNKLISQPSFRWARRQCYSPVPRVFQNPLRDLQLVGLITLSKLSEGIQTLPCCASRSPLSTELRAKPSRCWRRDEAYNAEGYKNKTSTYWYWSDLPSPQSQEDCSDFFLYILRFVMFPLVYCRCFDASILFYFLCGFIRLVFQVVKSGTPSPQSAFVVHHFLACPTSRPAT